MLGRHLEDHHQVPRCYETRDMERASEWAKTKKKVTKRTPSHRRMRIVSSSNTSRAGSPPPDANAGPSCSRRRIRTPTRSRSRTRSKTRSRSSSAGSGASSGNRTRSSSPPVIRSVALDVTPVVSKVHRSRTSTPVNVPPSSGTLPATLPAVTTTGNLWFDFVVVILS